MLPGFQYIHWNKVSLVLTGRVFIYCKLHMRASTLFFSGSLCTVQFDL
jgi:hypothetical protein